MPSLRIASLNLQGAFQKRPWTGELPRLLADHKPDVVLLQECKKHWLEEICDATGLEGELSYSLDPELPFTAKDGCAVAVRAPLRIVREWRIPPDHFQPKEIAKRIPEDPIPDYEELPANLACRYSGRAPFAEVALNGERFVAASFHATPGRGMVKKNMPVHEFKPFFHGAVALALADLELPYVFGIDANEPLSETLDRVTFHWEEGRSGRKKFAALLDIDSGERLHPARDLLRESLRKSGGAPETDTYLARTHELPSGGRRYDSIWATPEFKLERLDTYYEDAWDAGTDHALLVAELTLDNRAA